MIRRKIDTWPRAAIDARWLFDEIESEPNRVREFQKIADTTAESASYKSNWI